MTQEELRDLTDVSQQYLSKLEGGLRNPTITILMKIAAGLNVSLYALLEGLEEAHDSSKPSKEEDGQVG